MFERKKPQEPPIPATPATPAAPVLSRKYLLDSGKITSEDSIVEELSVHSAPMKPGNP